MAVPAFFGEVSKFAWGCLCLLWESWRIGHETESVGAGERGGLDHRCRFGVEVGACRAFAEGGGALCWRCFMGMDAVFDLGLFLSIRSDPAPCVAGSGWCFCGRVQPTLGFRVADLAPQNAAWCLGAREGVGGHGFALLRCRGGSRNVGRDRGERPAGYRRTPPPCPVIQSGGFRKAGESRGNLRYSRFLVSMTMVTGPSFTRVICMSAPKRPRPMGRASSCSKAWQNAS